MKKANKLEVKSLIQEVIERLNLLQEWQSLNESSFARVVGKYFDFGFIAISADRTCEAEKGKPCTEEEVLSQIRKNKKNEQQIKSDIRAAGFGFIPVLGGYKERVVDPETGEETLVDNPSPEQSFIIPFSDGYSHKEGNTADLEKFKALGAQLTKKYNQDSFLFKPPNSLDKGAYYLDRNGNTTMTFSGELKVGNLMSPFFTRLKKGRENKRLSFVESNFYIPNPPASTSDARKRYGELFIRIK